MKLPRLLTGISLVLLASVSMVEADDTPPRPLPAMNPEQQSRLSMSLEKLLVDAQKLVEGDPKSVEAYSRRGDALFFLGRFPQAVADYDQMIALDAKLAESHWRRGIGLFYANNYKEAAAQFEIYHSFDQIDRENGIWRYLSQFMAYGREKARQGLLKYEKDDREPFPSVYKLFAGSMTSEEIVDQISKATLSDSEREKRLFYAHLYIGLNDAVEGNEVAAQQHLRLATQNKWGPTAGYGPHYMWHVGRLHEEMLRSKLLKGK